MEEVPGGVSGSRRNEDIALDLMKFVAMTTGYGRTSSSGVGFQGTGAASLSSGWTARVGNSTTPAQTVPTSATRDQ